MRKNKYEYLSPDLTPLIDVVFILLIFFIVSSSFKKDKFSLNLELPDSTSTQKVVLKKELSIEVNKDYISYMGNKLSLSELKQKLTNIQDKQKSIMINIDKSVSYQKVITILNILQENSLNNIAFVTNQK